MLHEGKGTYLCCNVNGLDIPTGVFQRNGRSIDIITLAFCYVEVHAGLFPRLDIEVAVPEFDLGSALLHPF